MRFRYFLFGLILILLNINFILAEEFGYNILEEGINLQPGFDNNTAGVNHSIFADIWITSEGNKDDVSDILLDEIGDVDTTGVANSSVLAFESGTSNWIARVITSVSEYISWNGLAVDFADALLNSTVQDLSLNQTEADGIYLNLSGTNADRFINISPFNLEAENINLYNLTLDFGFGKDITVSPFLGDEKLACSDLSCVTNWSIGTNWGIAGGLATYSLDEQETSNNLCQPSVVTPGKTYNLTIKIDTFDITAGSCASEDEFGLTITTQADCPTISPFETITEFTGSGNTGTFSFEFTAGTGRDDIGLVGFNDCDGDPAGSSFTINIDSVSVKEVLTVDTDDIKLPRDNLQWWDNIKALFGTSDDVALYFNTTDFISILEVGVTPNWYFSGFSKYIFDSAVDIVGNLNVTGNITSENVFVSQYIFAHDNATMVLASANAWANVTFYQEEAEIKKGINHTFNDNTNDTFNITKDGIYELDYNFDIIDTSVGASDIDVAGRVIYSNGTEIIGSVFETDITKQNIETELSHSLLANFKIGDRIIFQFIADDADVEISTHGTFGDHPESASIIIKKVANL